MVRTFPKSNRKWQKEAISLPVIHGYMSSHLPGLAKGGGVKLVLLTQTSLLVK